MGEEGVHCNILLIYQNSFEEKLEILLCSAKANEICQLQKEGKGIRGVEGTMRTMRTTM